MRTPSVAVPSGAPGASARWPRSAAVSGSLCGCSVTITRNAVKMASGSSTAWPSSHAAARGSSCAGSKWSTSPSWYSDCWICRMADSRCQRACSSGVGV